MINNKFTRYQKYRSFLDLFNKQYWTLSLIEFLFWFAAATSTYLTVFLQKNGFTPSQVGLINAINAIVMVCATPFWGMAADKLGSIRKVFVFCTFVGLLAWIIIPASLKIIIGPLLLLYLIIPFGSFFRMPANSLLDSFAVQYAEKNKFAYGNARLWGSISFAVMNITLSMVLPYVGIESSFYMYGIASLPLIIIIWRMKDADSYSSEEHKKVSLKEMKLGGLFKNYYYVTYLVFAIIMLMPTNTSMVFLPYLVDNVGGDTVQLGLVSGYRALLEIPMLLLMKPLRKRYSLPVAIVLGCVFYCIENLLFSRANSFKEILFIMTFQGLGDGLIIGAATNYVYQMAPDNLRSTAQAINGTIGAIAAIIGSLVGGSVIMKTGVRNFYLISFVMILSAVVYFITT
ncbi:MAG: MFS transporter, partial [Prevotella sp.]|nr:MFS transporter [Prevotella sp.]